MNKQHPATTDLEKYANNVNQFFLRFEVENDSDLLVPDFNDPYSFKTDQQVLLLSEKFLLKSAGPDATEGFCLRLFFGLFLSSLLGAV